MKEETALEISGLEEVYSNVLIFDGVKWAAHFHFANVSKGKPMLNERNKFKGVQFIDDLNIANFSIGLDPLFYHLKKTKILENKVTKWR